jgi:hypothetical protein
MRYLKGTKDYFLRVGAMDLNDPGPGTCVYTDATWGNQKDAHSVSGSAIFIDNCIVHWTSKKQSTIATSTFESELAAITESCKDIIWIRSIQDVFADVYHDSKVHEVRCDNLGTTQTLNSNAAVSPRARHILVKLEFIKSNVRRKRLRVTHVAGDDNIADMLTKPMSCERNTRFCNLLFHDPDVPMGGRHELSSSSARACCVSCVAACQNLSVSSAAQ